MMVFKGSLAGETYRVTSTIASRGEMSCALATTLLAAFSRFAEQPPCLCKQLC